MMPFTCKHHDDHHHHEKSCWSHKAPPQGAEVIIICAWQSFCFQWHNAPLLRRGMYPKEFHVLSSVYLVRQYTHILFSSQQRVIAGARMTSETFSVDATSKVLIISHVRCYRCESCAMDTAIIDSLAMMQHKESCILLEEGSLFWEVFFVLHFDVPC